MKSRKLYYVGFIVAVLGMLVTQCGGSDSPEVLTDLEDEVLPEFVGGTYEMSVSGLNQEPAGCLFPNWALALLNPLIQGSTFDLELPSGVDILDSGNEYLLTITLPPPLAPVDVVLSLDDTYENILMDGPEEYTADVSSLGIAGANCVITGSADGIFDDINAQDLTGSLTIGISDVQASPGGICTLLNSPAGDCDLTVNINAGVPTF